MGNNRILRSPDVSVNAVTLKSDFTDEAYVPAGQITNNVDDSYPVKSELVNEIEEVKTLNESELKALLSHLKNQEIDLELREKALDFSLKELEVSKTNYKEVIYDDLKHELDVSVSAGYEDKVNKLNVLIDAISDKIKSSINDVEDEIISIVYESVCKVIGTQMKDEKSIISVVREVMKFSQDRMEMVLRVSTDDYEIIKNARDKLSTGISNRVNIVADELVRYGGCIIETTAGRIDGRLEQQMESLRHVLLNGKD